MASPPTQPWKARPVACILPGLGKLGHRAIPTLEITHEAHEGKSEVRVGAIQGARGGGTNPEGHQASLV